MHYHVVPRGNDGLHVQVTGEEGHDAVGHDLTVLDQDAPKVPDNARIVPDLEPAADRDLIRPTRDNEWEEAVAGERHGIGFLYYWRELEHLGVHVERGYCPGRDDDAAEALKDGLDSKRGI